MKKKEPLFGGRSISDLKSELRDLKAKYPEIAKLHNDIGLPAEEYRAWQNMTALTAMISHLEKK